MRRFELDKTPKRPVFRGIWDFGKGYAHLRNGQHEAANKMLARVEEAAGSLPASEGFRGHSPAKLLGVLGGILRAEIDRNEGRIAKAIGALEKAVAIEDNLQYDEPEPLNFSARHWLGDVLLEAGRPADAEVVFRAALNDHPKNGWSLYGLEQGAACAGANVRGRRGARSLRESLDALGYVDTRSGLLIVSGLLFLNSGLSSCFGGIIKNLERTDQRLGTPRGRLRFRLSSCL